MHTLNVRTCPSDEVKAEGASGVTIQWLLDETLGAPTFAMRRFVLAPGGHTPSHTHPWEHEVYILRGRGILVTDSGEHPLEADTAVLVVPDEPHQFRASDSEPLELLCLVPNGAATCAR